MAESAVVDHGRFDLTFDPERRGEVDGVQATKLGRSDSSSLGIEVIVEGNQEEPPEQGFRVPNRLRNTGLEVSGAGHLDQRDLADGELSVAEVPKQFAGVVL